MSEKERLNQEQEKIRQNKFLKMVDRSNAIKSVRSLSRTIEDLIAKEKEKISEHYQSKLEKIKVKILILPLKKRLLVQLWQVQELELMGQVFNLA